MFTKANVKCGEREKRQRRQNKNEVEHDFSASPIPIAQFLSARGAFALMFARMQLKPHQSRKRGQTQSKILKTFHFFLLKIPHKKLPEKTKREAEKIATVANFANGLAFLSASLGTNRDF